MTIARAGWFMSGVALLVVLNLAGEWLVRLTGAPVPGSVIGMMALTALLETGVIPMHAVRPAAELLVRHLALLYVPAGAALVVYAGVVRHDLLPITVAALASLVAVLAVIGMAVQRLGRDP